MMYPGLTQAKSSRPYSPYERRGSYSNDQTHGFAYNRPHLELPRPLEPRPTLQSSLSEASGIQRRHEPFRGPLSPEFRSQGQNLPGLRDILSPGPHQSSSSYTTTWNAPGPPLSSQHHVESHYIQQAALHPPMTIYPPTDPGARYQIQPTKQFEVPILETSPVGKQIPPSLPLSPYSTYPDSSRDYSNFQAERHSQISASSHLTNGVSSPFTPAALDDAQYRSPAATYDRSSNSAYVATSADSQKKYLGVKQVPGEGEFHVYEGGFRLPTQVDGEQVNPAWGLTKANKPRKRLALACLDCREKKIKCEPGATSCLQCEKAKRTCRRYVFYTFLFSIAHLCQVPRCRLLNPTQHSLLGKATPVHP